MDPEKFRVLAQAGYNRIPVIIEALADLDTPLSAYLKIASGPYSYLLESALSAGEKWSRYSFIGLPARTVLRVVGTTLTIETDGRVVEIHEVTDPLAFVESFIARFRVPELPEEPPFLGGLVGYFAYDTVRYVEKRLHDSSPPDQIGTPDVLLMVSDDVIVFDNVKGRMKLITLVDPASAPNAFERANERLANIAEKLKLAVPPIPESQANQPLEESDFVSEFGEARFKQAVGAIKEYILAGDCMQVVLAQRMQTPFSAAPINLYRALRSLNPSPYMFYMDLADFHIVSSSPEILARLEGNVVTTRPLAGTRRRGDTKEEDLALEQELLADAKEIAEHLMLIDLGRNDVGRIATTGSVNVPERMVIERYSHVMHISSTVTGTLRPGRTAIDVLRATLPVGTLSGAPKIRAMEIIDELEPSRRGIFGGAVGYLAWGGNMDTAIAIRTGVVKDGTLYVQAGAGVVADSLPDLEWKETMAKARAVITAAALAERRFAGLEQ